MTKKELLNDINGIRYYSEFLSSDYKKETKEILKFLDKVEKEVKKKGKHIDDE